MVIKRTSHVQDSASRLAGFFNYLKKNAILILGFTALLTATESSKAAVIAIDNASNYSSWNSGDNFGSGFGAWVITTGGGGFGNGGKLISTSAGTKYFDMYTNANEQIRAVRTFNTVLDSAGANLFSTSITLNSGTGGSGGPEGFNLQTSAGTTLASFFVTGGSGGTWKVTDAGNTAVSIGATTLQLNFDFQLTSATTYTLNYSGGATGSFSGTLSAASTIAQIEYFNRSGIGNTDLKFTNLQIQSVPEPSTYALLGTGLLSLYFFRRRPA